MKNFKTFMMATAAVTALGLSAGTAMADGNSFSKSHVQQREYRTPMNDGNRTDMNRIENRDDTNRGARYDDDARQYRADRGTNNNIRWGSETTQHANVSAGQLQLVQRRLRDAGHSISVDGVWGPETAGAVREYQEDQDLAVTGRLNSETLSALNVSTTNTSNNR